MDSKTPGISQRIGVSLLFMSPLDHTWLYANEVTCGRPLELQDGGWSCQEGQSCGLRVGALSQVISAQSPGKREVWRLSSIMWPVIHQLCLHNETPIKTLNIKACCASWLVKIPKCREGDTSWFHREDTEVLCSGPSHPLPYGPHFSDLALDPL